MITIANSTLALPFSARVSTTDVKPGMIVTFIQGTASGEQPQVRKATLAEIQDATVPKGIVEYFKPDSTDVDFDVDPATQALTLEDTTIPQNAQVTVWMGKPVVTYYGAVLAADLAPATVREATKVGFDADTNFPAAYLGSATDGREICTGFIYRVDGPAITIAFSL
jgi:hypothetical protein